MTEWLQFGFCIGIERTENDADIQNWDCLEVKAELNIDKLEDDDLATYSQTFDLFDGTYTTI